MRRLLTSLLVPLVLLTPACGKKDDKQPSASPQEIVLASVSKTTDKKSAKLAMKMDIKGEEASTITAEGSFDWPGRRGSMTMSMPDLEELFGGSTIEMIMVGTVIYMKLPANTPDIPPQLKAKPWLKLDLAAMAEEGGLGGAFGAFGNTDPSGSLDQLRGVSGEVTVVGEEQVRGTATTRYKGTIDLDKAVAAVPVESQKALRELIAQLGTKTIPFEAWVDEDGLLRRMRQTMDLSKAKDNEGVTSMDVDLELYDFGVEVKAEAPPAGEVTDLSALLGGAMGDS